MGYGNDREDKQCGSKGSHGKPDFYGAATVGEKGQVVIPQEARQAYDIEPGDKLLVAGKKGQKTLLLVKSEVLTSRIENLGSELDFLRSIQDEEK